MKIPSNQFRASFKPESYDEEKRTIDVIFTTGARVKRYSFFDGPFFEELEVSTKSMSLDRLNRGAPVLNNHGTWGGGLRDILGVVEKASIKSGEGVATLRFSSRPEIQDLIRDIKEGVIRNVSVGYQVNKFEEKEPVDGVPVYRAIDWEPYEISFVGMPADAGAQARSQQPNDSHEVTLETREEQDMSKQKRNAEEVPAPEAAEKVEDKKEVEAPAVEAKPEESKVEEVPAPEAAEKVEDKKEVEAPAVEAKPEESSRSLDADAIRKQEIERQDTIRKSVRIAGLDEAFADTLVSNGVAVEQARSSIFEELEKRTGKPTKNQNVEVRDMDQRQLRRDAAVRALLHRFHPEKYKLQDGDREFRQGSVIDLARKVISMEGESKAFDMSRTEVARRALHSTSDFPEILANTANKSLRDAYEGAPNTYAPLVRQKNVSDFKEISSVQLGNGGKLMAVNEHGEYKRTTVEESAEKYRVQKYGLILGKTLELIVNDDLDAFTRIPAQLGVRAREKENEIFWGLIIANAAMADGIAYFHASHGNLTGVGTAISVASLGVGRAAMRLQTDLEGELMNVSPRYLVVPAAKETLAQQFLATTQPTQGSEVNPFSASMQIIVEPRLDAASGVSWYMAADKAQLAVGEMALLDGAGPEIFTREGFEIDGMEMKLRYIFGMKLIEHRAMYKNAGA